MTTTEDDVELVDTMRPENLGLYVGQWAMKELIVTHTDAARKEGRRLPHLLLLGAPGSGKTTIAHIVAGMMGVPLVEQAEPLDRKRLLYLLEETNGAPTCLFLDEIHEWGSRQDALLTVLDEEAFLDTPQGRFFYPNLTVIAATTEQQKVRKPLRQRFPLRPFWEDYTDVELAQIASHMAEKVGLDVDWETCEAFGRASAGVPRQARTLVLHAKALATTRASWSIGDVLSMAGVRGDGLTHDHATYLRRLRELGGMDVGLETMSERLRLAVAEVRDLERLLLDRNLITLRRTGRALTPAGRTRLQEET